jgi:carbon-monoxide dehydrogenase medium subunit
MIWNRYHIAESLEDALAALRDAPGSACPVGGGTDLLLEIQQGHRPAVDTLVDLTRIPELTRLELREDYLFIGAGVPVSRIATHPLVWQHAAAVCEACALIGGPQVRNTATLGGNVAHALPAADGMIALVTMDAEAEIAAPDGLRRAPILTLFRGPGQTALDLSKEFLVGFRVPARKVGEGCGFSRVMRPQGVALPILNMAAWLQRDGERIADIRIAVGPAGPQPQRAKPVEDFLRDRIYSPRTLEAADEIWHTSMRFRSSPQRASSAYRYHLSGLLFQEVMDKAWQRSFESAGD